VEATGAAMRSQQNDSGQHLALRRGDPLNTFNTRLFFNIFFQSGCKATAAHAYWTAHCTVSVLEALFKEARVNKPETCSHASGARLPVAQEFRDNIDALFATQKRGTTA
jgi:hypothetical protein